MCIKMTKCKRQTEIKMMMRRRVSKSSRLGKRYHVQHITDLYMLYSVNIIYNAILFQIRSYFLLI